MNLLENEIFSCASYTLFNPTMCCLTNSTISIKSPNYADTDEIKNMIQVIRIEDGNLSELPEKLFLNYRNLTSLTINRCGLSEITSESFKSAVNLVSLSMEMNNIVTLNSNIFKDCKKLTRLDLSENLIENISSNVFQPMVHLIFLNLGFNRIKSLDNLMFSNMEVLILRYNQIEGDFANIFNVSSINLDNNLLTSLRIENNSKSMEAENNKISKIIVDEGSVLEIVTLRNNNLTDLRNISKCTNLIILRLSENNIQVRIDTFSGLSKLQTLDISKNNETIGEDLGFLESLKSLKYLTVQKGAITNYNFENILKIIPDISLVQVTGDTKQIDYNPYNDGKFIIQPRLGF